MVLYCVRSSEASHDYKYDYKGFCTGAISHEIVTSASRVRLAVPLSPFPAAGAESPQPGVGWRVMAGAARARPLSRRLHSRDAPGWAATTTPMMRRLTTSSGHAELVEAVSGMGTRTSKKPPPVTMAWQICARPSPA